MTSERKGRWIARQEIYYSKIDRSLLYRDSPWQNYIVNRVLDRSGLEQDALGLEIGAGMGRYSIHLLERGFNFDPSELSEVQVDEMHRQLEAHHVELPVGRKIIRSSLEEMAETVSNHYGYVVGFNVLHHISDLPSAFSSIRTILTEGGSIAFQEPNPCYILHHVQAIADPRRRFREELGMLRCTRSGLTRSLHAAGFSEIRIHAYGFLPPFVVDTRGGMRLEEWVNRINPVTSAFAYLLVTARASGPPRPTTADRRAGLTGR